MMTKEEIKAALEIEKAERATKKINKNIQVSVFPFAVVIMCIIIAILFTIVISPKESNEERNKDMAQKEINKMIDTSLGKYYK